MTRAFVIFLLQDKVRKEKKIELPAEKSHNFLMRGIKRIRRKVLWENYLTTVSPNFSQFGPGAADLEFKMHVQLAYFLLSKNRENIISAASKSNEIILGIITPQETPQRNQFSLTMGL